MKTERYEYDVVAKEDTSVLLTTGLHTREDARDEARCWKDYKGIQTAIIQRRYALQSVKTIR